MDIHGRHDGSSHSRHGLGFSAEKSGGHPEAGQVPQALKANGSGTAPAGFVRPQVQPMIHHPVRWTLGPANQAGCLSGLVPQHSELLGQHVANLYGGRACGRHFAVHAPLSEAIVRRIIETCIPMKARNVTKRLFG